MADDDMYSALSEALNDLIPQTRTSARDRGDRGSYGDYGLDVKANVTRGRPLYGFDDFVMNPGRQARDAMPDEMEKRYRAARELAVEDRTRDLVLERREIIGDELQKRLQLERYNQGRIQQNKIDNDGVGWMADYNDLNEQGTLNYEGIVDLDKKYPFAKYSPDIKAVKDTDYMTDLKSDWEARRKQEQEQATAVGAVPFQRQQATDDMNWKMQQAGDLLSPDLRSRYNEAVNNGMSPTQAMAAIERGQSFLEEANKLRGMGVGKSVLDGMVEKDPTTGEQFFNREKLGELQSDIGFIKQANEALTNYSDRIKALKSGSGGKLDDLASDKKTSVIAEYEKAMEGIQKAKSVVERRVMGDNPVTQAQDAVNAFLDGVDNTPQGNTNPQAPRTQQDDAYGN